MNTHNRLLFTSYQIGDLLIKNRFVRSATFESAADDEGAVGDDYIQIYSRLAKGEVGLIITGMIFTTNDGKSYLYQAGLHSDRMIAGFSRMTTRVHEGGSKVFAQLCHGGRQSMVLGLRPPAPSANKPDLFYRVYPRAMGKKAISDVITSFGEAARRAKEAGFDGVQIHAAHGYLISEFLSPYFNQRTDEWGGNSENRFNLLRRVYQSIRETVGSTYPIIVKINIEDYTPKPGLSLEEAKKQVARLIELGIDAIEISCGTLAFSAFNQIRGEVPIQALAKVMPAPLRPATRLVLRMAFPASKYAFYEDYNLPACDNIKPLMGNTPLILVGGLRNYNTMERIIRDNKADFISISRPFIRQPTIVKKWSEGNYSPITCTNCNNCFGAIGLHEKLKCNRDRTF